MIFCPDYATEDFISVCFSLFYLFSLYSSLAWQFNLKPNLNKVFILQSISFLEMSCQNNPVHEVHTRNSRNNLFLYIPRMFTSLWNELFKDFFPNHDLTFFLKLKSFLMKRFLQTYKNES